MPRSASSMRANCGARSIALSFQRRRNAGEAAFELIGGRPGEAQAEISIGNLEPVAGAYISAMLLQQTTVERVGSPSRVGDHARKADDTARRTHPFEHRLTRDPFGHPVEPSAPFAERRRQESITPPEHLLR